MVINNVLKNRKIRKEKLRYLIRRLYYLNSPTRQTIYDLCLKKPMNITQIKEVLGISYKSTLVNIQVLEEAGLIERNKKNTEKAKESLITSIPIKI